MNFKELHKQRKQLEYAEAIVKLSPTMDNMKELKLFRNELKNKKRKILAVAN
nr:hypothetical protein 19 [Bacillaceae bacterium]